MDEEEQNNKNMQTRGDTGAAIGGAVGGEAGEAVGTYYGGPVGGMVGRYVGEKAGSYIGDKVEDELKEELENQDEEGDDGEKKKGGSCGGGSGSNAYQASDKQCHANPEPPRFKLEIEENKVPENWWDKLPDFDPRVYDAIAMEQAAACVKYVFDNLPEQHELEHLMEARKGRKICPRLKVCVPRTKVKKPKEIKYETVIDTWIKKDQTY